LVWGLRTPPAWVLDWKHLSDSPRSATQPQIFTEVREK
jgi:hypothetical protein